MRGHRKFSQGEFTRIWRPAAAAMLGAAALLAAHLAAAQPPREEQVTLRAAISLPSGQKVLSFDISWVDPSRFEYYLADRTNAAVDVVDTTKNHVIAQLKANFAGAGPTPDTSGPNGILTISHFVWAGDFGNGSNGGTGGLVRVYDLDAGALVATIATGGTARADELCYDPKDHVVMIANDAEPLPPSGTGPYLTFIGTSGSNQYKVLGRIFMNGTGGAPLATNGIEQCQYDRRTGLFYVNIPEVNGPGNDSAPGAVLTIDPVGMAIVDTFTIPHSQCEGPQGMDIGPKPQILLGCNDPLKDVPKTVTINENTGKVINTFANEDGSDEVWFNPGDGHYYLGESGGANPQHLGVIDASTASGLKIGVEDQSQRTGIPGGGGAHSVAADSFTNKVFVPIPSTAGAGVCSSIGGDDSVGCIAVYKAGRGTNEGE
jgi:hypothetical protein